MRNTGAGMPTQVFLQAFIGERAAEQSSSTPEAAERAPACKLGATGELLQGPAIAIRITKIGKRPPNLHIDLTDVNAPFDQFLADGLHVRDHHQKPFEGSRLHGGNAHPYHDGGPYPPNVTQRD